MLLAPLGLAALAALAIPLLIHLYRRTEEVPVEFAALRWLQQRPRPRRRLRFDEWPLLIVRLLLIAALAFLLAEPAVRGGEDRRPRVLVVPGADPRGMTDTGADVRWLAPGFPAIDTPAPAYGGPTASLIRQFDAEAPRGTPLTIIVPTVMAGADADRLRLGRPVRWRVVAGRAVDPAPIGTRVPDIALRLPDRGDAGGGFVQAAVSAWRTGRQSALDATRDASIPAASAIVWLRAGTAPDALRTRATEGATVLLGADTVFAMPAATGPVWHDPGGATLVEGAPLGRGRVLRFTRPLSPAVMPAVLEPDFADRLRALLAPPSPAPTLVEASHYAPMVGGTAAYPQPPRSVAAWLTLLIAGLFLVERWLATGRRGAAA